MCNLFRYRTFLKSVIDFNSNKIVCAASSEALNRSRLSIIFLLLNNSLFPRLYDFLLVVLWLLFDKSYNYFSHFHDFAEFSPTENNRKVLNRIFDILAVNTLTRSPGISFSDRIRALPLVWRCSSEICLLKSRQNAAERIQVTRAVAAYCVFEVASLPKIIFVSNDHSPVAMALMHCSSKSGSGIVYAQHAPVTPIFPALKSDLAILFNRNSLDVYMSICSSAALKTDVVFLSPYNNSFKTVRVAKCNKIVISLAVSPKLEGITSLLYAISDAFGEFELFIRPHPRTSDLLTHKIISLCNSHISKHCTIISDWGGVDIHFCGNSGVILDALHNGIPTFYVDGLDNIMFDYYGFVSGNIVPTLPSESNTFLRDLSEYYNDEWRLRFKNYDHTLIQSADEQKYILRKRFKDLCKFKGIIF